MANHKSLTRRSFVAGLLGTSALSGCALGEREVFEGDLSNAGGAKPDTRPAPEGGIGGTGITGVGVVGVLTDFGSVRINGLRLETPPDVVVVDAFGAIPLARLAIGHSLTVEALREGAALRARRITLTQPLVGAVDAVEAGGARLRMLGVAVEVETAARRPVAIGERIAVSGLWRGPIVVASRLDPAPRGGRDAIAGALAPPDASGSRAVGGGRVVLPLGAAARAGAARYVSAVGRWAPQGGGAGVLKAESARFGRFSVGAPLTALSVEGYLERIAAAPFFEVSGLGHSFDAAAELAPFAADRTLFAGPYTGDFAAETGVSLPAAQEARRALLRQAAAANARPVRRR